MKIYTHFLAFALSSLLFCTGNALAADNHEQKTIIRTNEIVDDNDALDKNNPYKINFIKVTCPKGKSTFYPVKVGLGYETNEMTITQNHLFRYPLVLTIEKWDSLHVYVRLKGKTVMYNTLPPVFATPYSKTANGSINIHIDKSNLKSFIKHNINDSIYSMSIHIQSDQTEQALLEFYDVFKKTFINIENLITNADIQVNEDENIVSVSKKRTSKNNEAIKIQKELKKNGFSQNEPSQKERKFVHPDFYGEVIVYNDQDVSILFY